VILPADHSRNIHTFDLAIIMLWKVVAMRKPSSGVSSFWKGFGRADCVLVCERKNANC
jgi:hypothetical protein